MRIFRLTRASAFRAKENQKLARGATLRTRLITRADKAKPQAISAPTALTHIWFFEEAAIRPPRQAVASAFFNRAASRDTLREPVFLWTTPRATARISSDWASMKAVLAA